jgi:membrane protease subunit (stomatin/prohibitin family)
MQQGSLIGDYGKAVKDAANNANGAANGMLGIGMMNMASGGVIGGVAQGAFNGKGTTAADLGANAGGEVPAGENNFCPKCGTASNGANFCPKCGTKLQ